jgi:hypothetical protein
MEPYKKTSDYIINMDFASLYPHVVRPVYSSAIKVSKIKKILDKLNDSTRTQIV